MKEDGPHVQTDSRDIRTQVLKRPPAEEREDTAQDDVDADMRTLGTVIEDGCG